MKTKNKNKNEILNFKLEFDQQKPQDESMYNFLGKPHTPINKDELNYEFVVLGMLSDYCGLCPRIVDNTDVIECFYPHQDNLARKFISFIDKCNFNKTQNKEIVFEKTESGHINIRNKVVNCYINHNYFKIGEGDFNKRIGYKYSPDENNPQNYVGVFLRRDIFKTHIEKISYIYGCYLRYGKIDGENLSFGLANSVDKWDILPNLLADYADSVNKTKSSRTIPTCMTIYCNSKYLTDLLLRF